MGVLVAACGSSTSSTPPDAGSGAKCVIGSNKSVPGADPVPASCNPAWNPSWHSCGPNHDQDCCASKLVPGGTFFRDYDGVDHLSKAYPATVKPFRLDTYEITVGRFRAFLEHGWSTQQNPPPEGAGKNPNTACTGWDRNLDSELWEDTSQGAGCESTIAMWDAGTLPDGGLQDTMPTLCAFYYAEIIAFCAWDGGFLPTEGEWGFAASGGSEQRVYPWSVPPTSKLVDAQHAVYGGVALAPVGSRSPLGDGRWRQADLAGNAAELVLDVTAEGEYQMPCDDCTNWGEGAANTYHGGSAMDSANAVESAPRTLKANTTPIGARCARAP